MQRETGEGALWTRPLGAGRIIVSGFGSIFTNRALGLADNAQLLANMIAANVGARGSVLFDDVHQGLGAAYDPDKFYKDKRLYTTLGVLLAALAYLGAGLDAVARSSDSCHRAARSGARAGNGRILRARSALRMRRRDRLLDTSSAASTSALQRRETGPPWELLERHPRVAAADLEQSQGWYAEVRAARRVPLGRLHNLILRIDRQLT